MHTFVSDQTITYKSIGMLHPISEAWGEAHFQCIAWCWPSVAHSDVKKTSYSISTSCSAQGEPLCLNNNIQGVSRVGAVSTWYGNASRTLDVLAWCYEAHTNHKN